MQARRFGRSLGILKQSAGGRALGERGCEACADCRPALKPPRVLAPAGLVMSFPASGGSPLSPSPPLGGPGVPCPERGTVRPGLSAAFTHFCGAGAFPVEMSLAQTDFLFFSATQMSDSHIKVVMSDFRHQGPFKSLDVCAFLVQI